MVNELSREQLETKLKWYEERYGSSIGNRGVHNWKNLFRKPNLYDWTILFMLIMGLFIAWSYQHDIQACREYIKEQQQDWYVPINNPVFSNLTINEVLKESAKQDNNS